MSEKINLGKIDVVTDCDTGMYRIGEIDGGFNGELRSHIKRYGSDELLLKLSYMANTVIELQREINSSQKQAQGCSS